MSNFPEVPMDGTPEQLAAAGGIYYFETPPLDGDDQAQAWVNVMGVELPTNATAAQVEAIKDELVVGELDAKIFRGLAECYSLRQPILLESDPSSGKTFLTERFFSLINGSEPMLSMAGTPRTSDHEVLGHYSPSENGWKFVKGSLLEAATGNNGEGRPLFIDEFGLIPANYQQLFLPISGQHGSLAESISVWGNGDEQTHKMGARAWFAFATNFPERTPGRHLVTDAMASRLVWMAITDSEAETKEGALIRSGFGRIEASQSAIGDYAMPEQTPMQLADNPELAELVTEAVAEIHGLIKKRTKNPGDSLGSGDDAEPRIQQIDITPRDAARLFKYIERFPVRDPHRGGQVDMTATLFRALERHYIGRFASTKQRDEIRKDIEENLTGSTGAVSVAGRMASRDERFLSAQQKKSLDIPGSQSGTRPEQSMSTRERQDIEHQAAELREANEKLLAKLQSRGVDTTSVMVQDNEG